MSTYEALFDLQATFERKLKDVLKDATEIRECADLVLDLAARGVVDLGGLYLQRLVLGKRRLGIACKHSETMLASATEMLHQIESDRVRRDVAFRLNEDAMVTALEADIDTNLKSVEDELQEAFTMLEIAERTISEMTLPRLVVG